MRFAPCAASLTLLSAASAVRAGDFTVITDDHIWRDVTVVEVTKEELTLRGEDDRLHTFSIEQCVGLLNNRVSVEPRGTSSRRTNGLLVLVDGQQFPGYAMPRSSRRADELVWRDLLFGDLHVPFDVVSWVKLSPGATVPEPGDADVVRLANDDEISGLVLQWGDPLPMEVDGEELTVDFSRIASIRLVNPDRTPGHDVSRVWLRNATIMDVPSVTVTDDGVFHLVPPFRESANAVTFGPALVSGLLFDASRLTPLSTLTPQDVEGPATRYTVPAPVVDNTEVALGLKPITFQGPLTARYTVPSGATRFLATVRLHPSVEEWGDCEVVIRDDDREVFRGHLDAHHRALSIAVELSGAELSIEILEGRFGPIQDTVIFDQAMILGTAGKTGS